MVCINVFLVSIGILAFLQLNEACQKDRFRCLKNYDCISRSLFCDGRYNCRDQSDEAYCNYDTTRGCPSSWFACKDQRRCIPSYWRCDGVKVCRDGSDELGCNDITLIPEATLARTRLVKWLLEQKRKTSSLLKWGSNVHITAVPLFLSNENFFSQRSEAAIEIPYEISVRLLDSLSQSKGLTTQELALYIQALLMTCVNPRSFHRRDLVAELRRRVDSSKEFLNPFPYLVLCNAGDIITNEDAQKVMGTFYEKKRPLWIDNQALAAITLTCFSTKAGISVAEESMNNVFNSLKSYQNSTDTNLNAKTVALIIQALMPNNTYSWDFDLDEAVGSLVNVQMADGSYESLLNAYYILPTLSARSLLNVSSDHCTNTTDNDEDSSENPDKKDGRIQVMYSVWVGDKVDLVRSWTLRIPEGKTSYELFETVHNIDNNHKVAYDIVDGKPYVTSLVGYADDPIHGLYWFMYKRPLHSRRTPSLIEQSPADFIVPQNHEIILWYKKGVWNGTAIVPTTEISLSTTPVESTSFIPLKGLTNL